MDNFSSHKVAGIREAIEAVGAKLVYLSPYSLDFSPIENCWSKVKVFKINPGNTGSPLTVDCSSVIWIDDGICKTKGDENIGISSRFGCLAH